MSDFLEYIPSCGKSVLWLSLSSSLYFLGESPECPECGEKDLSCRLSVAESLLPAELEGGPRPCPFKVIYSDLKSFRFSCWKDSGCTALISVGSRARHATTRLFRPVRCPKAIFSSSCLYKGPYCTIQVLFSDLVRLRKKLFFLEPREISAQLRERRHQPGTGLDNYQDV